MSHSTVRGTDWEHSSDRVHYNAKKTVQRDFIGFRVVHDDASQALRGGGCGVLPQHACVPVRNDIHPGSRYYNVGFRLAREDT